MGGHSEGSEEHVHGQVQVGMKSWDGKTKQEGSSSVWWMQAVREQRTEYLRGHKAQTWPPWTYGHKGGAVSAAKGPSLGQARRDYRKERQDSSQRPQELEKELEQWCVSRARRSWR